MAECPTPWKDPHPTKAAAVTAAARVKHDRRGVGGEVYECTCGSWHLTRGQSLTAKIRTALRSDR